MVFQDKEQVESAAEGSDIVGSPVKCENPGPGGPLIFDFLSLAKLEERCSANNESELPAASKHIRDTILVAHLQDFMATELSYRKHILTAIL